MADRFRWDGELLTLELLDAVAKELRASAGTGTPRFNFMMHGFIIRYFLGEEWFHQHVSLDAHQDSFFRPNFQDSTSIDPRFSVITLELAELLLNLQFVLGFRECLNHLSLEQIQSGLAELHVGQVLRQKGIPFKYVEVGDETTVDIIFLAPDGSQALCEIKCKYETTAFSRRTLSGALSDASGQIGKGNPGVVFIKVPTSWMNIAQVHARERPDIEIPGPIVDATKDAIRQYTRIKKVIFVVCHYAYAADWGMSATHTTMEFSNPKNTPPWDAELLNAYDPGDWYSILALGRRWAQQAINDPDQP